MNMIHTMIANTCRGCVEDNSFNEAQKKELISILEKFQSVKTSNIWKFTKYLKQFDDKYAEYGGNVPLLEERIQKIRDEQYLAAAKTIPGIKLLKKEE